MRVTSERLAGDLLAEYVITHRAGGNECNSANLAQFISICTDAATKRQERRTIALMSAITRAVACSTKREADEILISIQSSVQAHALQDP